MGMTISRDMQFDQFVQFAQKSMATGNTKAVARAEEDVDDGLAARSITAATTDKAFALIRSKDDKTANDAARSLFRQSVRNMFGGEENIPESVRKAMLLKDYDVGKPLTARRIIAVKQAIELAMDSVQNTMTPDVAKTTVDDAIQRTNIPLAEDKLAIANGLVEKYGKGLTETGVKLLANFTVNALDLSEFTCAKPADTAAKVETAVKKFVKDMSKWRTCDLHDTRLTAVDQKMANEAQALLAAQLGKKGDRFYPDGHRKTFVDGDSHRAHYIINGQQISPESVVAVFTDVVKRPGNLPRQATERQAISSFLCQTHTKGGLLIDLMEKMGLSTIRDEFRMSGATPINGPVKGMELLVSSDPGDTVYKMPKTQAKETTFTLNVSPDGKSATVLVETKGDIVIALNAAKEKAQNPIGSFTWQQEFVFDLTGDQPKIVEAHIGQQLEA